MKYRLLLIAIPVALLVIGFVTFRYGYLQIKSENSAKTNSQPAGVLRQNQKLQQLGTLAERLNGLGNYHPTEEETEEGNRYFREQVAAIGLALLDHDFEQRLKDTEQLGAYPIPEAVELLSVILETDQDPSVREMAAQTLSRLDPGTRSIDALLRGFEDPSDEVKSTCLLSLELFLNKSHKDAQRDQIMQGLERNARNRSLPPKLHANLIELLLDQPAIE